MKGLYAIETTLNLNQRVLKLILVAEVFELFNFLLNS